MIAGYLPDSIEIISAGHVKNIYNKTEGEYSLDELMKDKFSMKNIPKKNVPLFCIMLKINQT